MPVISTPPEYRFPWYIRLLFWMQKRHYGAVFESARLWGRIPKVFMPFVLLYRAFERRSSPIDPQLRSLVMVRVSQINHCAFCVDLNSAIVLQRSLDSDKLVALSEFKTNPLFSDREQAALAYAEAMTYQERQPAEEHFEQLRRHFDEEAIIELTGLIAFQNMSSKFNTALGVESQGFCAIPSREKQTAGD
ncbi:carboxymuconolactone decarboxylase family protein [Nitrosococcus wardiae]|uniref:Carboxymuconolactone decarboxylase family protein n=1 Tax=Nitrosococcus wardiae TaxID=1814290 RepID=A0A4P7C0K7_9GAMM|nr:carboxymuconolactone decarboxylase family protein [Nitrosococcus wardiae]QBQ55167.1 carboxymuconolactone decarboxylase family protein [Nitrosococcus wardiae]